MRIDINKKDIEIILELIHSEINVINRMEQGLNHLNITKEEKHKRIIENQKERKKLYKINNKLLDKIIEMEYYEEQNTKHKDNGTDNTFFKYVADILSRDYRNEEKSSTDN